MRNDKISWSIPVLAVAIIMMIIYFLSCLLGIETLSFVGFGGNFFLGSALGYIVWLFID